MSPSFTEFQAAHQARLAAIAEQRQSEVDRAAAMKAAAEVKAANDREVAEREHADATHDRLQTFQERAAVTYDPLVRIYVANPDRSSVAALADALIEVEDEA